MKWCNRTAYNFVDENNLLVADVKELGRRIIYAIEEPAATQLPPDEGTECFPAAKFFFEYLCYLSCIYVYIRFIY